jgi:hypothetical protein
MRRVISLVVLAALSTGAVSFFAASAFAQTLQPAEPSDPDEAGAAKYREQLAHPASGELAKPTPRLADGRVDFGGKGVWAPLWVLDWSDKKWVDKAIEVPFTPWGLAKFSERRAKLSKDDPESYCLPPGVPRYTGLLIRFRSFTYGQNIQTR